MPTTKICDLCTEAAQEEAAVDLDAGEFYEDICLMLGADLPDHLCEQVENGTPCDCPCHPNKRQPLRV